MERNTEPEYRVMYGERPFTLGLIENALKDFKFKQTRMKHLFQYAVILHEYEQKEATSSMPASKVYKDSKLIIEPKYVLADSEKSLIFKITREIPEEYATDPENVEIKIRNF
jgi:hypothetical protein